MRLAPLVLVALAVANGLDFGACTQDDAFISLRYAQNLLDGHGLVYNPGERVEGISNLSWTLLLAGALALGLDISTRATGYCVLDAGGMLSCLCSYLISSNPS